MIKYVELFEGAVGVIRDQPYPADNPWTIEAPAEVDHGWTYDGATWSPPAVTPEAARAEALAAMREQWDGLPAWIRGPFQPLFASANALLDAGDDDAAIETIRYASPMAAYSAEQIATFEAVKAQFISSVESLIP